MTDETVHIATAAALLGDPYAALNQHLHGDGDAAMAACGACEDRPKAPNIPCAVCGNVAALHGDSDPVWRTRALAAEAEVERLRAVLSPIVNHALFHDREYLSQELNEKLDAARAALSEGDPR